MKRPVFFRKTNFFKKLGVEIFDFLFPSSCEICEKQTSPLVYVCEECLSRVSGELDCQCSGCGAFYSRGPAWLPSCAACVSQEFVFKRNLSALPYEGEFKALMLSYKFGRRVYLGRFFANKMIQRIREAQLDVSNAFVTWVPLHRKRLVERRFNQAEVLAKRIAEAYELPFGELLKRKVETNAQAQLDLNERASNIKGVFEWSRSAASKVSENQVIWLVDDVFTSGATVNECAEILRKNVKIREVIVLTAFHG